MTYEITMLATNGSKAGTDTGLLFCVLLTASCCPRSTPYLTVSCRDLVMSGINYRMDC